MSDDVHCAASGGGTRKAADFFVAPGAYHCAEAGLSALLLERDGEALLQLRSAAGAADYRLSALGPGLCLASACHERAPPGGLVEFDRLGFRLSTAGGGALRFLRAAPAAGHAPTRPASLSSWT